MKTGMLSRIGWPLSAPLAISALIPTIPASAQQTENATAYVCQANDGRLLFVPAAELPNLRQLTCIPIEYRRSLIVHVYRCKDDNGLVIYTDQSPLELGARSCSPVDRSRTAPEDLGLPKK